MDNNYYKGLDVKSNSIKIREKRKLVNKNLILDLRKTEEKLINKDKGIKIKITVPKLLGLEYQKNYHHLE